MADITDLGHGGASISTRKTRGAEIDLLWRDASRIFPLDASASELSLLFGGKTEILWRGVRIWYVTLAGDEQALMFSTITLLGSGKTVYFGAGGISTVESEVAFGISAGAALELVVTSSVEPGAGRYRVTVRKNGTDTAMMVTLTGNGEANTVGSNATSVPFAAKDKYSMLLESLDGAPDAVINAALKYRFAT